MFELMILTYMFVIMISISCFVCVGCSLYGFCSDRCSNLNVCVLYTVLACKGLLRDCLKSEVYVGLILMFFELSDCYHKPSRRGLI